MSVKVEQKSFTGNDFFSACMNIIPRLCLLFSAHGFSIMTLPGRKSQKLKASFQSLVLPETSYLCSLFSSIFMEKSSRGF